MQRSRTWLKSACDLSMPAMRRRCITVVLHSNIIASGLIMPVSAITVAWWQSSRWRKRRRCSRSLNGVCPGWRCRRCMCRDYQHTEGAQLIKYPFGGRLYDCSLCGDLLRHEVFVSAYTEGLARESLSATGQNCGQKYWHRQPHRRNFTVRWRIIPILK